MPSRVLSDELYQNWLNSMSALEALETKMNQTLESALDLDREKAEDRALQGIVRDINTARDVVRQAWKKYEEALDAELAAEEADLAEMYWCLREIY